MKIIEPSVELINAPDYKTLLTTIEAAGRTCYKSEDKITDGSAEKFVRGIIKRGHEAVIRPSTFDKQDSTYRIWQRTCKQAEVAYFDLLNEGCTPQEARSVLPNSLKTEVVMTADIREWRHFLKLRCAAAAHPDMRVVANMLLTLLKQTYPVFFEDIES